MTRLNKRLSTMLLLIGLACGLAGGTLGCASAEPQARAGQESYPPALPDKIRGALDRAASTYPTPLKDAKWVKFETTKSKHPIYQIEGTNYRGNKIELEVTSAGRVIEVEELGIPIDEVPQAVIDALNVRMPEFSPSRIEAIYQTQKTEPVCYGFEGLDIDGREVEIYVSADGKTFLN